MDEKPLKTSLWINILLLLFVIVLFGIFFEIIIRIFFPITDAIYTGDEAIGYKHIPNKKGINVIEEGITKIKFNSEGFRDVNHDVENKDNSYRVVMLGDSFVDALQVDFSKTFYQLTQEEINQNNGNIEVFNFGISAFSTPQEYLTYTAYAEKYNPNLVYLFFFTNDPSDGCGEDNSKPTYHIENGIIKQRPFTPNEHSSFEIFISNHLKSLVFLRAQYYLFKNKNGINADLDDGILDMNKVFLKDYDEVTEECWEISLYFLEELKKEVENSGAELKIIIIPHTASIYEVDKERLLKEDTTFEEDDFDFEKPYLVLEEFLEEKNIEYLNLMEVFKKSDERVYLLKDGHFNKKGHEVVKDVLVEDILNRL
jgi:hypothetical protein